MKTVVQSALASILAGTVGGLALFGAKHLYDILTPTVQNSVYVPEFVRITGTGDVFIDWTTAEWSAHFRSDYSSYTARILLAVRDKTYKPYNGPEAQTRDDELLVMTRKGEL